MKRKKNKRLRPLAVALTCAAVGLVSLSLPAGAENEPAGAEKAGAEKEPKASLAPDGECAKPRELARASDFESFDITGAPAARFVPAQVAASMPIPTRTGPPAPPPPVNPGPGVCDSPRGCSPVAVPAFIESEPVPSLPPGVPPPQGP